MVPALISVVPAAFDGSAPESWAGSLWQRHSGGVLRKAQFLTAFRVEKLLECRRARVDRGRAPTTGAGVKFEVNPARCVPLARAPRVCICGIAPAAACRTECTSRLSS